MAIIDQEYLTAIGGPVVGSGVLDALSAEIVSYIGHAVEAADYIQWVDGVGAPYVVVDEWPVSRIYFASCGKRQVADITFSGTGAASIDIDSTGLTVYESGSDTAITFAAEATYAEIIAAIDALTNWTCTIIPGVDGTLPSVYMFPAFVNFGLQDTRPAQYLFGPDDALDLIPDHATNRHLLTPTGISGNAYISPEFNSSSPTRQANAFGAVPAGSRNVLVHYRAGWESGSIPDALKSIAGRMASDYVTEAQTSGSLKSVKIGDYSHTKGDVSATVRGFAERYAGELAQFSNVEL